jgi:transposase-like protein
MKTMKARKRKSPRRSSRGCKVVAVGKRRDGRMRYWCLRHRADATAKYGKPLTVCRAAHIPPLRKSEVLDLNIDKYRGGVALWGAMPAVYDTTRLPIERGIHVHARPRPDSPKELDFTYRAVRILSARLPRDGVIVSEFDAIYYMASSVFGYEMKYVTCTYCGHAHLDRDWFSVHPHRRHLCADCGRHFSDTERGVGNPIMGFRALAGMRDHKTAISKRELKIKQADFPNGIQIWGSNPAFLWTSDRVEDEGIHVHGFRDNPLEPVFDETFGKVTIDGVTLNPEMVRIRMAQSALPSLNGRVLPIECPACGATQFAKREDAFTPTARLECGRCKHEFSARGRKRKIVPNPLARVLEPLAQMAPREPQHLELDLLPETL